MFVFPFSSAFYWYNPMFYTATSRTKEKLIIIGDQEYIEKMVNIPFPYACSLLDFELN